MRLRKNYPFSVRNIADMSSLQEDIDTLFMKSTKSNDAGPEKFIGFLITYFKDRPNIVESIRPDENIDLDGFSKWMASMHLKSMMVCKILNGDIKNPEIINDYKDDINMVKELMGSKMKNDTVGIKRVKTGITLRNTVDETRKEIEQNGKVKQLLGDTDGVGLA